ncbi:hypothetical protein Ancab_022292 [Ancistrocladus abbreviatus]
MPIGELFLGAFLQVLFDRIASQPVLDFFLRGGLDKSRLEDLKHVLPRLELVLDNAEEKQFTNDSVRRWLHDLKAAVFDAEDLLDQIATKNLPSLVEPEPESQSWAVALCNCVSSSFNPFEKEAASRLDKIIQMLDSMALQIPILGLTAGAPLSIASQTRSTTSFVKESEVYGRKEEKDRIIQLLLSQENEKGGVAIVGMGGMGKTTLARSIYNDDGFKGRFDEKLWIHVSNDFNVDRITKSALESVTRQPCSLHDLNTIQFELSEKLRGKKFLLVLDDVWSEKVEDWENLCGPFITGAQGSRIIVTARNEGVADIMGGFPKVRLHKLSKEDGWSLLSRYAFQSGSATVADSQLVKIGQEIVEKCDGLPLAIKILGSPLRSKLERKHWEKVRDSNIWDLPGGKNDILPPLSLSYCFLPSRLKRCFAYCAMFPKGYEFEKDKLVLLWMAEGFLCNLQTFSLQGCGGLQELPSAIGNLKQLRHLDASWTEIKELPESICTLCNLQRLSLEVCRGLQELPSAIGNLKQLRHLDASWTEIKELPESICTLCNLETLSLLGCRGLQELPSAIGNLKQLRRLDVRSTEIKELPESICTLCNLEALSLLGCRGLQELPSAIGNLKQLRRLDASWTEIKELPESICTLCNLEALSLQGCGGLQELPSAIGNLKQLQRLDVSSTEIKELPESICTLCNLQALSLEGCGGLQELPSAIGNLKQLQDLDVSSTEIKELPESICTLCNLQRLSLQGCGGLQELPSAIGNLKQLQCLYVSRTEIKELPESIGNLKQLRHLDVSLCTEIKELPESICTLCNLQVLSLQGCRGLQELPSAIGNLKQLQRLEPCNLHDLNTIQVELSEKLEGKKFLLVLDDVWSEKVEHWENLCGLFNTGAQGSRIIVTARNEGVADIMGGFPKVRLHKLSKEDGWSLLSRYAFQSGSSTGADSQLVKIGREIVEKCDGLPLAIKILGSLLRSKLERKHWEKVRDSNIWDLPGGKNNILLPLSLSYCSLPSRLKRCFAYCAMFPKGYEFEKDKLVLLWMAEGFLDSPNDNVAIEEVGDECFMELLSISFFDENKPWKIAERARHVSYHWEDYDNFDRFEALSKARNVRSFLSLRPLYWQYSDRVTRVILPELDPLRVLSLSGYKIIKLPTTISDLK